MTWLQYLLGLVNQYPDGFCVIAGTALSWAPGLILEQFLPDAMDAKKVKRLTLGMTIVSAFTVTTVLWHQLDKGDSDTTVGIVSFFAALAAPYVHIGAARFLAKRVPWVSSVFSPDKPPGP